MSLCLCLGLGFRIGVYSWIGFVWLGWVSIALAGWVGSIPWLCFLGSKGLDGWVSGTGR